MRRARFVSQPVAFALALLAGGYGAIQHWVRPSLEGLHQEAWQQRLEEVGRRVDEVLDTRLANLDTTCGDWAEWDSMYGFAREPSEEFIAENFQPDTVAGLLCSRILVEDTEGRVVARQDYDLAANEPVDFGLDTPGWSGFAALDPRHPWTGWILGPDGHLSVVSSKPIAHSDASGEWVGRIAFVRPLIGEELECCIRILGVTALHFRSVADDAGGTAAAGTNRDPLRVPVEARLNGPDGAVLGAIVAHADFGPLVRRRESAIRMLENGSLALLLVWLGSVLVVQRWLTLGRHREAAAPVRYSRALPLPAFVFLVTGAALSALGAGLARDLIQSRRAAVFDHEAQEVAHAFAGQVEAFRLHLGGLASLLDGNPDLSDEAVASFASQFEHADSARESLRIHGDLEDSALLDDATLLALAHRAAVSGEVEATIHTAPDGAAELVACAPFTWSGREFRTGEQRRADLRGILIGSQPLEGFRAAVSALAAVHGFVVEVEAAGTPAVDEDGGRVLAETLPGVGGAWEVRIGDGPAESWAARSWVPLAVLIAGLLLTAALTLYVRGTLLRSAQVEAEVRERTRELEEARREAERANRSKSAFLANMSHEIRTPMTAILGFTEELLEPGQSRADFEHCVGTIRRNGDFLLQIINDILDLSKIEAGRMTVESIACSPIQILDDLLALLRERADAKGLKLEAELHGPLPEAVHTDPTRLRQILLNLLGNAIKFTEHGGIRVRLRLLDGAGVEPHLEYEVEDTGIGLSEEQLQLLFQPFQQADASTTRRYGGTGLGLAICRSLAELLGGDIRVRSAVGRGTAFTLRIPTASLLDVGLIERPRLGEHPAATCAELPPPVSTALHCNVLIAEDTAVNLLLVRRILEKAGASCAAARNGREAVDMALAADREGPLYDLILMDMQMPVLDGLDATRELRAAGFARPIVALTANAMAEDRERCLAAGCNDFLTKPIQRAQLMETVARLAGCTAVAAVAAVDAIAAEPADLAEVANALRAALEARDWDGFDRACERAREVLEWRPAHQN